MSSLVGIWLAANESSCLEERRKKLPNKQEKLGGFEQTNMSPSSTTFGNIQMTIFSLKMPPLTGTRETIKKIDKQGIITNRLK